MRKALCTTADQSKAQRAVTTNHRREVDTPIVSASRQESKEGKQNEFLIYEKFREEAV